MPAKTKRDCTSGAGNDWPQRMPRPQTSGLRILSTQLAISALRSSELNAPEIVFLLGLMIRRRHRRKMGRAVVGSGSGESPGRVISDRNRCGLLGFDTRRGNAMIFAVGLAN